MSVAPISEADLVGLSALLYTLRIHQPGTTAELIATCTSYGLRAGAVPWESALRHATGMRLVVVEQGRPVLSQTGIVVGSLVAADMEPSDEFARAMLTFSIGRTNTRLALAQATLTGDVIDDPRGSAAPVIKELVDVGLAAATPEGNWLLQDGDFSPLVIGLLIGSPKPTSVTTEVGRIGEALTLIYYAEHGWETIHVSPISDAYGFDILCRPARNGMPPGSLAVEAKATTAMGPYHFYASRHELRVARRLGTRYEIALWGEIDRTASVQDNYTRLRASGFPRLIRDPYGHVETHVPGLLTGRPILGGTIFADSVLWHHA